MYLCIGIRNDFKENMGMKARVLFLKRVNKPKQLLINQRAGFREDVGPLPFSICSVIPP